MSLTITEKYLEAIKPENDWLTVSEWAVKVGELYPDILDKADNDAANQANETTGLREIAARISSSISRGAYAGEIEINDSERPRKIKYLPENELDAHVQHDVDEDVAPLRRDEIIKQATNAFDNNEKYRSSEFEAVAKQLKMFFGLDFEVDHAQALLNQEAPGQHHPDNLQLLLKIHNGKKNNKNWERFNIEEQIAYIETAINLQILVAPRLNIDMKNEVLHSLIDRLKNIYS